MIHNILLSIWHNKIRTLLILLLLIISYFLCFLSFTNGFSFTTHINKVKEKFSVDTKDIYIVSAYNIEDTDNFGNDITEIKKYVNRKDECTAGAYDIVKSNLYEELESNQDFINLNMVAYANSSMAAYPKSVSVLFIDPELTELLSTEFEPKNFEPVTKDGEIYQPMYIGRDFDGIINKGDILTDSYSHIKYIIKGVVTDEEWFADDDPVTLSMTSLNHMFVVPFTEKDMMDSSIQLPTLGKLFIKCDTDTANQFLEMSTQKNMKLGIITVDSYIKKWKDMYGDILNQNIFLAVVVSVCSAISIISVLCVSVILKKKEYGIRIAFGSSMNQILLSYAIEMIMLNIISAGIAFALCYNNYASHTLDSFRSIHLTTLCTYSLCFLLLVMIIMVLIVLLIPSILMLRYQPAILIKEEE